MQKGGGSGRWDSVVCLTGLGKDDSQPNRRLTEFTFQDEDGKQQAAEMLEVNIFFISGIILPFEYTRPW